MAYWRRGQLFQPIKRALRSEKVGNRWEFSEQYARGDRWGIMLTFDDHETAAPPTLEDLISRFAPKPPESPLLDANEKPTQTPLGLAISPPGTATIGANGGE